MTLRPPPPPHQAPSHLLVRCLWRGSSHDCQTLFTPVVTDSGICCAFNSRRILRETSCSEEGEAREYSCLVRELQAREGAGSLEGGVRKADYGRKKGLQLILDQHSNLDSPATLFDNDNGFKVFIGQPTEFPLLTSDHLSLSPGQQHDMRLGAAHLATDDRVRQLEVRDRGCLFPEEQPSDRPLAFHSEYSMKNCLFECALALASSSLGCTPWFLPSLPNSTLCNPWQAATFSRSLESTPQSSCSHCLPDCEATTYTIDISATPIRACDSRNLNLNPFCNLVSRLQTNPWIGEVVGLYGDSGDQLPGYIKDMAKATRPQYKYPEDQRMDVLLQNKVGSHEGHIPPVLCPGWQALQSPGQGRGAPQRLLWGGHHHG